MLRISLVLALATASGPAFADEGAGFLAPALTNTIVSTYPDGRTAKLWLREGGIYVAEGREHEPSNGHWRVRDGKLCLTQTRPFAFGFVYCTLLSQFSSGTRWTSKAVTGETIEIRLERGRPAHAGN
jgi:hypothetical protein